MSVHQNRILEHLEKRGAITSFEAFQLYGETRLASVINRLRGQGYVIMTDMIDGPNRYGEKCRFAQYRLVRTKK